MSSQYEEISYEMQTEMQMKETAENINEKNRISDEANDALDKFDDDDDEIDCRMNSDTACGFGCGYNETLQRFANENSFIIIYGLIGSLMAMTHAYFNGTITTLEKRFHLSSRSIGVTQIGKDVMEMFTSLFIIHYISRSHRPRWMGIGTFVISLFCLMTTLPHWLYGPGDDTLKLTTEFGGSADENLTGLLTLTEDSKNLCNLNATIDPCESKIHSEPTEHPMLILFVAHLLAGFGLSVFFTLGVVYMDDNVEKTRAASFYSFSNFLMLSGPAFGYTLASFCLRQYAAPLLTPVINNEDPRWIGAWWIGYLIIAGLLLAFSFVVGMFPKELPAQYKRKQHERNLRKKSLLRNELKEVKVECDKSDAVLSKSSFGEFLQILKRLIKNKIFMCNNIASIFFCFGYMPYWIFTPKYLEIVFHQSAAESTVYTGTVAMIFVGFGVLISGAIVSWKKPPARILAIWNAFVGILTVVGFLSYSFIGCSGDENSLFVESTGNEASSASPHCANFCHCEFVPYEPVCGENNWTYISACHAGCKGLRYTDDGKMHFYDCGCVWQSSDDRNSPPPHNFSTQQYKFSAGGRAVPGACPVNCSRNFLVFIIIMCAIKFTGSTTKTNYFLIQMRSIPVEDKSVAIAFGTVMLSIMALIPSPIFFGSVIDRTCLVWGKTCSEKTNCWLYDANRLRHTLNYTATIFFVIAAICDCVNCYLVKDLNIFGDDKEKTQNDRMTSHLNLRKMSCNI